MSDLLNNQLEKPMDNENSTNIPESSTVHVATDSSNLNCAEIPTAGTSLSSENTTDTSPDANSVANGDHGDVTRAEQCDMAADADAGHSGACGGINSDSTESKCDDMCRDKSEDTVSSAHDQSDDVGSRAEGRDEPRLESCSEDSGSDGEYESAEEGEEINVDADNLKDLEERLTDEEKEERRVAAQALKEEGNSLFKTGTYKTAIRTYSRALRTCPLKFAKDRAIMYSNRAACKMKLDEPSEAVRDCTKALDLHPEYLKARMRRAELYEQLDKLDEALADFQKVVEQDPSQHAARAACVRLPPVIEERNEKMKEEMMGKLKDLGNMVLRPFGLSTNNFKLNQDPNTGGYSVNFVQNPDSQT